MSVRIGRMRIRMAALPAAAGLVTLMALAAPAAAGCGTSSCQPAPPSCCQPPPPPPPPPTPPGPCCQPPAPPPHGGGGGSNINVNVNVNANASATASARSAINARAGSSGGAVYVGGGSAYVVVDQPYPTHIQGLNVEGARVRQVVQVPYTATRRSLKRVVIQAVCVDDRNVPHPAAQVRPGREVREDYEGELYRCIAGARLQATLADYRDDLSFDGGETLACAKGEALWLGRDGALACRVQKRERDCNERSLLRRYGAGIKIVTLYREETYTEYREEVVEQAGLAISGASMTLDGGVGGRVF